MFASVGLVERDEDLYEKVWWIVYVLCGLVAILVIVVVVVVVLLVACVRKSTRILCLRFFVSCGGKYAALLYR